MTPADIDRVFGRSRLRMVTGEHVEVFREESKPGERRRYTKRFLATPAGDFSEWTEREWRILARLVGHGIRPVPDVVQFDRGAPGRPALVQTYDAGVTVDHWATLLPLKRDGRVLRNVFEDCAHWWALARHCLVALDAIHELQLVHLDLKADNICIPLGPANFEPGGAEQPLFPRFEEIALIDFAFSLVSGEALESPLPIAHQADYVYQSPRLLQALDAGRHAGDLRPTQQLDWRCDLFSLAAMLWRYLPEMEEAQAGMWTARRHAKARSLVRRIMEAHDAPLPAQRPHAELIAFAGEQLADPELTASLQRGWTLALDHPVAGSDWPTPVTQIAPVPVAAVAAAAAASAGGVPEPAEPVLAVRTEPVLAPPEPVQSWPEPIRSAPEPLRSSPPEPVPPLPSGGATPAPLPEAPISIDRSDMEDRDAGRRQRQRERARHLAWGGALAVATVAALGLALSSPAWLKGRTGERDGMVQAPAPVLPATLQAPVQVARAPVQAPAAADIGVAAPAPVQKEATAAKQAASLSTPPEATVPTAPLADAPPPDLGSAKAKPMESPPVGAREANARAAESKTAEGKAANGARAETPAADATSASGAKATGTQAPVARSTPAKPPAAKLPPAPATPTATTAAPRRQAAATAGASRQPPPPVPAAIAKGPASAPTSIAVAKAAAAARHGAPVARPQLQAEARPRAAPRAFGDGALLPRQSPAPVATGPAPTGTGRPSTAPTSTASISPAPTGTAPTSAAASNGVPSQAAPTSAGPIGPVASAQRPDAFPAPAARAEPTPGPRSAPAREPEPVAAATLPRQGAPAAAAGAGAGAGALSELPRAPGAATVDFGARAGELMNQHMPRLAQRAERQVLRVLFIAGRSEPASADEDVAEAAAALARMPADPFGGMVLAPHDGRLLNEAGQVELQRGRQAEALRLQSMAFGANPLDAEVAGNLAHLLLRQRPGQAETARQLALHALTLPDGRPPQARVRDWTTLAVASALAGRERDARNAWLVSLALAPNAGRQCKAAIDAYAAWGDRLRGSVEAMLQRASGSGRAGQSPFCEWPPHWVASTAGR